MFDGCCGCKRGNILQFSLSNSEHIEHYRPPFSYFFFLSLPAVNNENGHEKIPFAATDKEHWLLNACVTCARGRLFTLVPIKTAGHLMGSY